MQDFHAKVYPSEAKVEAKDKCGVVVSVFGLGPKGRGLDSLHCDLRYRCTSSLYGFFVLLCSSKLANLYDFAVKIKDSFKILFLKKRIFAPKISTTYWFFLLITMHLSVLWIFKS